MTSTDGVVGGALAPAPLPTGTLTFLMTDLEGSTALWEQHEALMRRVLPRHDALLDALITQHGGQRVRERGEGDSIFAVFRHPDQAVAAALAIARTLQAEPWPAETPLRVRMALHTGSAELREGDYYGPVVNRCARIRGLSHGGQILLSSATAALVHDVLPAGAALRALGAHRLKGLAQAEEVYQLLHPELPSEFPPLLAAAPQVYASFAQPDRPLVARLSAHLEARGVSVWSAEEDVPPGTTSWEQALRDAIRAAALVLVVASPHTRRARHVADELRVAELYGRPVLPLWVAGEQWMECIPLGWGGVQYLDARRDGYAASVEQIVAAVQAAGCSDSPRPPSGTARLAPGAAPRNPFKGLRAFGEHDAGDFFGREGLIGELLAGVGRYTAPGAARFLAVVGPSGSGKSSVVLAGLLPRLRAGGVSGSARWVYLDPLLPGAHPLESLAVVLTKALPGSSLSAVQADLDASERGLHLLARRLAANPETRVVLVVDQAEELFTLAADEEERRQFIDLLVTATAEPQGPVLVVLTLRADFYDRPMSYIQLGRLVDAQSSAVLPLGVAELRAAIEGPARLPDVGLRFEGDLVGDLLYEVREQAGSLPLLQFTLDQLFERRAAHLLTEAAYQELGGARGALARHAEATYATLPDDEHRALARALFLRLIEPGTTEQDTVRRRAVLTELALADLQQTAMMRQVAEAFIKARLLITDERAGTTTIEVSHEALIGEWARLAAWLHEAREDIRLQQAISADAAEWWRRGRPGDYLYRGTALDEARAWAERNTPSATEMAFLEAGRAEREREEAAEREQQERELELARQAANRLRTLIGVLIVFLAAAAGLAAFAANGQRIAESARATAIIERGIARSGQLAAQAVNHLDDQLDLALLLSMEALRVANTVDARYSLLQGLESNPSLIRFLHGHTAGVTSVAFSPDGKTLASGSGDSTIRLWDVASGQPLGRPLTGHTGSVQSVAFSPDGKTLASGGKDNTIRLWDVVHRRALGPPLIGHTGLVYSVAFSPDGKTLVSGGGDNTIRLWDVVSGQPLGPPLTGHTDRVLSVAFSPDGKTLASGSGDNTIRLWDVVHRHSLGRPLTGHTGPVLSVAFSPDGKTLASGSEGSTIRLWDVASKQPFGPPLTGHTSWVQSVAFSPDGKTLASGSGDNTIRLWDVASGQPLGPPLTGHTSWVQSVAFSPDGKTLVSASADSTIRLWDVVSRQPLGRPLTGHMSPVQSVAFSPDGKTLASGSGDYTIRLWDVASGQPLGPPLTGHTSWVQSVAFSPDGKTLASGGGDNTIRLWDVASGQPLGRPLTGHTSWVQSVAFSRNGKTLASASGDNTIRLWDVVSGQPLGPPLIGHTGLVYGVAFSPDGKTLALGNADNTIRLWDIVHRRALGPPLVGHTGLVYGVAFSPDGKTLASGSADNTIRLWDVASGQPLGPPLTGHTDRVLSVAFSPDGKTLASGSADNTIRLWDVNIASWERRACRIANRNLTTEEWVQYLGDERYHKTCPNVP